MQDTVVEFDKLELFSNRSSGSLVWGTQSSLSVDCLHSIIHLEGDSFASVPTDDGFDDEDDSMYVGFFSSDDEENEIEATSEGAMKNYEESEEMPASIQSWAYQMSSGSDSGSEYEYGFLPGMQNTIARRRAISNAQHRSIAQSVELNSDSDNTSIMDEDSAGSEYNIPSGELEDASWECHDFVRSKQIRHSWGAVSSPHTDCTMEDVSGCLAYGNLPSPPVTHLPLALGWDPTTSVCFLNDPNCIPFGTPDPFGCRKLSSILIPFKEIPQQHQQHPQHEKQTSTPPHPLHGYRHQQVEHASYDQYQSHSAPLAEWVFIENTESAARGSIIHPRYSQHEYLGLLFSGPPSRSRDPFVEISCKQARVVTNEKLIPSPPLGRRGGRPVPPTETDLRWNIWTVGNLEIRCTASGVGVKHLREVLHRDDNYTGYRRSKWTHERLSAEVIARRTKQEAKNEVVGRPQGFLAHQGWWFYVEALQKLM